MFAFVASAYALSAWTQLGQDINGERIEDYSGYSVAMSSDGSRVAIGAYANDGYDGLKGSVGHVRVWEWVDSTWTKIGEIDGEIIGDLSGYSVAISSDGTRVAIGAPYNNGDNENKADSGHVRVWELVGSSWTLIGEIYGENTDDRSGWSVAMSSAGSRVAIGAPYNNGDNENKAQSGHVRVYDYNDDGTWTKIGEFYGENYYDESGWSVAMSSDGSRVAIGAPQNDGDNENKPDSGHVRVWEWVDSTWTKIGEINGENTDDRSGWSVAMSSDGSRVAIGAKYNDGNGGTNDDRGHVRVYDYDDGTWTKIGEIDGENADDDSGWSVAMSSDGTKVAIGAKDNDGDGETKENSGHVRVYEFKSTEEDDGLSTGAIVGIAVGATAGAVAIGAAAYYAVPLWFTGGKYKPVGQPFL